jgi:cardiolipin synthase
VIARPITGPACEAPRLELLVSPDDFWTALERDIAAATDSVYVQTMTFEADTAGTRLADALVAARARDRRLLLDSYTRFTINDRFLFWPPHLLDRPLQREARATRRLVRQLDRRGVRTRFLRPYGLLFARFAGRDHKKIVTVDDRVAYIGGRNFSDHNFAWDDLMVRIEHPDAARLLADDVRATWAGRSAPRRERFGPLELHLLDGRSNERELDGLRALLAGARRRIDVLGPYVTVPMTRWLDAAAPRSASTRGSTAPVAASARASERV